MALLTIRLDDTDIALALAQVAKAKVEAGMSGDVEWERTLEALTARVIVQLSRAIVAEVMATVADESKHSEEIARRCQEMQAFGAI